MTGIVLAGGENRRMGTDKAFLSVDGRPLIQHVLAVLTGIFPRVIIVTNSPEAYGNYVQTIVTDVIEKRGPLTGIHAGLRASVDEYNFIVACDMPFLNPGLITFMTEAAEGYDVVVPELRGQYEPLHALYHRRLLPAIEGLIARDSRAIQELFSGARVRSITVDEINRFDPRRRSFINLNTPQEYKEVLCSDSVYRN